MFIRREECANRPRSEFVPKTLADLNIDAVLHGSAEGGMNGGRFIHPSSSSHTVSSSQSSNTHLSRTNAGANRNVYSSQQNLSKTNSNYHSNFSRSRNYGSQQSLSNVSSSTGASNNHHNGASSAAATGNHYSAQSSNNNYGGGSTTANSPTDVWLNAWNTPNSQQASSAAAASSSSAAAASPSSYNYNTKAPMITASTTTAYRQNSSSSHLNSYNNNNSKNTHFNKDPWTGDLLFYNFIFNVFD